MHGFVKIFQFPYENPVSIDVYFLNGNGIVRLGLVFVLWCKTFMNLINKNSTIQAYFVRNFETGYIIMNLKASSKAKTCLIYYEFMINTLCCQIPDLISTVPPFERGIIPTLEISKHKI